MNTGLIDRAVERIATTNKAIAASVLVLLITWNTGIEPMYAKMVQILARRAEHVKVQQTRRSYTSLYEKITQENVDNRVVLLHGDTVGQRELQEAISDIRGQEISLTSELRKLRTEAQLPLKLYGLEFSVRPIYAPFIWLVALAAIVGFVTASRHEVFNLISRHLSRVKGTETPPDAPLEDHAWWMHPFPRYTGANGVTGRELHAAANLGPSHARMHQLALLCILIGVGVTARILWIAIAFVRALSVGLEKHYLPSLLAGVAILLSAAIYLWLRPMAVPDSEPAAAPKTGITRREALMFSVLAVTSVAAYPLIELSKRLFAPKPRFRRWRPEQVGFYPADITDDIVGFIAASPDGVAQVLRENLAVAPTLSAALRTDQVPRRVVAAQLNAFLVGGGSMKIYNAAGTRVSLSTKSFAQRKLDRVGMMRFGRAVLHDHAPAVFRSVKRRWREPVAHLASA